MSRIGNKPISVPEGVTITNNGDSVLVKGPKGEFVQPFDPDFKLSEEDGQFVLSRPTEQKRHKALHGLYRSLIQNAVVGVTEGYKKELELVGVGYRANVQNNVLELTLGYSHNIFLQVPTELKVTADNPKGKSPLVTLEGIDKQLIGDVAAKIRSLRKVEPYKGKGVRFVGEQVRRKAGKAAAK
ncbi:MAG: 50S ribosomal protein L6 [Desulfobulbia bacterium]